MREETRRAIDKVIDKAHAERERRREPEMVPTDEFGVQWYIEDAEQSHWTLYQACSSRQEAITRSQELGQKHTLHRFRPIRIVHSIEVL